MIELCPGDDDECKDRPGEEDDGQEKAVESCRDIITADSKEDNVDGGCEDTTDTLSTQYSIHVVGREASSQAKQSSLEYSGKDVDDDDGGESKGQELLLPGV